jgi:hypothetical protein
VTTTVLPSKGSTSLDASQLRLAVCNRTASCGVNFRPAFPDDREIRHPLPGRLHGVEPLAFAKQGEIGPQDAAQEAHAVDDYLIIIQDVDVSGRLRLQLLRAIASSFSNIAHCPGCSNNSLAR